MPPEMMQRLQRLEQSRPDPAPYQARVWDALTEPQRAFVRAEMQKSEDEMAERRAERRMDELRRERGSKQQDPTPGSAPGSPAAGGKGAPAAPGAESRAQRTQQFARALGVTQQQAEMIQQILFSPPRADEKGVSFQERMDKRIDSLPKELVNEQQRAKLREILSERERRRAEQEREKPARGMDAVDVPKNPAP